jgi:hypothetical protein
MSKINLTGPDKQVRTPNDRQAQAQKDIRKEAVLQATLKTPSGLKKIAAALTNPVRRKLDYVGLMRKFTITELWPVGMPLIFDRDVEEFTAVVVGNGGAMRYIEIEVERVELTPFQLAVNPRIPWTELYNRLYQVVKRTKERIEQGMALREDLIYYAALEDASTAYHPVTSVATFLTKDALARSMTPLEFERIPPTNILMTAYGIQGIRRWQYQDIDDTARMEIRKSGYLGNMWGAQLYISDQISAGTYYVMGPPELHSWTPFRKEAEVIPADVPWELILGFVGWEYYAQVIHNVRSCVKGMFATNV